MMAYRDYQELVLDLLRKRIADKKRRAERIKIRDTITGIREKQKTINQFIKDYPYCEQCDGRRPRGHKCYGNIDGKKETT